MKRRDFLRGLVAGAVGTLLGVNAPLQLGEPDIIFLPGGIPMCMVTYRKECARWNRAAQVQP